MVSILSAVRDLGLDTYPNELHAHQYAQLHFRAADDDRGVVRYEVRMSTSPITDAAMASVAPTVTSTSLSGS